MDPQLKLLLTLHERALVLMEAGASFVEAGRAAINELSDEQRNLLEDL